MVMAGEGAIVFGYVNALPIFHMADIALMISG